ncbi:uncharacterized protein LOC129592348 [Paramacrobiotus metropolitanus]|uniref:uncharacterized protein LOC129592348 n=1 Tax=Paramacrobiotus metropolitanus TaxID=2943436 RepID=UPI002445FCD3|nr:uncharacterized protein LOC129592348 [Paramacrobiotus metropolitanus]
MSDDACRHSARPEERQTDYLNGRFPALPADVLRPWTSHEIVSVVGQGAGGCVVRIRPTDGIRVGACAWKQCSPRKYSNDAQSRARRLLETLAEVQRASADCADLLRVFHWEWVIRQEHLYISLYTEYCDGGNLAAMASEGRMTPFRLYAYARQILGALSHLHARGILHRDLKGENVFLTHHHGHEQTKLGDFDFSTLLRDQTSSPDTSAVGTPLFMAPEVLQAEAGVTGIGPPSDMWSFGCLLLQLANRGRITLLETAEEGNVFEEELLWTSEVAPTTAAFALATGATPKFLADNLLDNAQPLFSVARECWLDWERRPTASGLLRRALFDDTLLLQPIYSNSAIIHPVPEGCEIIMLEPAVYEEYVNGEFALRLDVAAYRAAVAFVEALLHAGEQCRHPGMLYPQRMLDADDPDSVERHSVWRCRSVAWTKPFANSLRVSTGWDDLQHLITRLAAVKARVPERLLFNWTDTLSRQLDDICSYIAALDSCVTGISALISECFVQLPSGLTIAKDGVMLQIRLLPYPLQRRRQEPLIGRDAVIGQLRFMERIVRVVLASEAEACQGEVYALCADYQEELRWRQRSPVARLLLADGCGDAQPETAADSLLDAGADPVADDADPFGEGSPFHLAPDQCAPPPDTPFLRRLRRLCA